MHHRYRLAGSGTALALLSLLPLGLAGCVVEPGYAHHERFEGRFGYEHRDLDDFCARHPDAERCEQERR